MKTDHAMTGPRFDAEAGFSLAELLVAFAVVALVLAGATTAFQAGTRVLEFGVDQAAAQQAARAALQRVSREIRWAGYGHPNPVTGNYNFTAIAAGQTAQSLTLQNDFNGNGNADPPAGACDATAVTEQVRYRLDGTDLRRSENPGDPACDVILASGIAGLTFQYLDGTGVETADPAQIRTVVITMRVTSQNGATERAVVMRDEIRLRNR
jgi:type II secretory pathway component PulJ